MSLPEIGTNTCIVVGSVTRAPEVRTLGDGRTVTSLELRTAGPAGRREVVPVAVEGSSAAAGLAPDTPVVVVGRVRQRFFRAGGATQSRTEVVADALVPARQRARAARAVATARRALEPG